VKAHTRGLDHPVLLYIYPEMHHTEQVFELDFSARSDCGLVRKHNQDVARVVPRLGLALVAGGIGGHGYGDIASGAVADGFEQCFSGFGGPGANGEETLELVLRSFDEANQRLSQTPFVGQGQRTGTTLVTAVFANGRAIIGHIGDSRCYRLRNRTLEVLTEDHSFGAEFQRMLRNAALEVSETVRPLAQAPVRYLNGEDEIAVDTRLVLCEPGDVFLLCSDGLWSGVADRAMAAILEAAETAREACDRLTAAAWVAGGLENIAVAVVRLVPRTLRLSEPSWLDEPGPSACE
jgi:protein phosphatase